MNWLFSDPLAVGTQAPDFTLPDDKGNPVSLKKLRGENVVLVFYPRDETSVCTQQLCEFRDRWPGRSNARRWHAETRLQSMTATRG